MSVLVDEDSEPELWEGTRSLAELEEVRPEAVDEELLVPKTLASLSFQLEDFVIVVASVHVHLKGKGWRSA